MILIIALDGLDPDLVDRFAARGQLPRLARLARSGVWGRLRSTHPPVSVPAWSTFLTGVGPGRHGLFDFTRLEGQRVRFTSAADRLVPTLFELADAAGRRTCSIGIPTTYPVAPLRHGAALSGFDSPFTANPDHRGLHPEALWAKLRARGVDLGATRLPQGRKGRRWHARAALELERSIERRLAQALGVLEAAAWDLLAVHFQAADTAGHHFFRYFDSDSPRHDAQHPERAGVLPRIYARLDDAVGRLIDACPDAGPLLILSDHGMGPASDRVIHLNRWLEQQGLLRRARSLASPLAQAARGLALRRLPRSLQQRLFRWLRDGAAGRLESSARLGAWDLTQSVAFSEESSTLPGIWLVDPARREEVLTRLRAWPAVRRAHRREDLYRGPAARCAPHILLELEHGLVRTPAGYRGEAVRRLESHELDGERGAGLNGVHRPEGWLAASGWPGAHRGRLPSAWIGDLAPTLLAQLQVSIPDWMEGQALRELVGDGSRRSAAAGCPSPRRPARASLSAREGARLERNLRALGYLG